MSPAPVLEPASVLLNRVESLPYPQRMRLLALHAREHADHPGFEAFLRDMADQGHYGRRTAVHLAIAARHFPSIERALAGPEPEMRRAALRAVRTLPVADEAVPPALEDASTELRLAVYRAVVLSRRGRLAERLLPDVHARWGAREAAALLPACGAETVADWLPRLAHAVTGWKPLGRRHPDAVLELIESEFEAGVVARRKWNRRRVALMEVVRADPSRVLDLLERHDLGRWAVRMPGTFLGALFRADLHRTVALQSRARQNRFPPRRPLLRRAALLTDAELLALALRRGFDRFLRALPVERRALVYTEKKPHGLAVLPLLPLLPRALAESEARRLKDWHDSVWHSARAHLDDPEIVLRIAAFLPFAEVEAELRDAAFSGDPRRRSTARILLLDAARRAGERFPESLDEIIDRTVNERDPVRAELLTALARFPLDGRLAGRLDRLARAVLNARDTSRSTRDALLAVADRAIAAADQDLTTWALTTYADLATRHGQMRPFDRVLRRGQERDLTRLLLPHLRETADAGDHRPAIAVARAMGNRLHLLPELRHELQRAVLHATEEVAAEAADLYLRRAPHRQRRLAASCGDADRAARTVALVAADPGTLRYAPVWRMIATRRSDMLPDDLVPVLAAVTVEPGMAGRWTGARRDRVAEALKAIADDRDRPVGERVRALRSLGEMPYGGAALVEHALRGEPIVGEAAVAALGRYPRVLSRLLLRIGGPVALATAATLCRITPPWQLAPALEKALFEGGVSARKLAARQLVSQRLPAAADLLLRAWADPALHPDARVAVAVALRRLPEDPRAFAALAEVPRLYASELMIRTLLQTVPEDYPPEHRPLLADLVRALLGAADGPGVRFRAAKAFATWVPWYREGLDRIVEAAVTGDDTDLTVFCTLIQEGLIREEVLTVLGRLLAAGDHSRTRRIAAVLSRPGSEPWRRDLTREAAHLLTTEPLHLPRAARLLLHLATSADPDPLTLALELTALADLLAAHPLIAAHLAHDLPRLAFRTSFLPAIQALTARADLAGGVLALAFLSRCPTSPEAHRSLTALHDSPHLELRQLAWDIDLS